MLLANNKYEITIDLSPAPVSLEFCSEFDPLYAYSDDLRLALGELIDCFDDLEIAVEILKASLRAGEILGSYASQDDLRDYVILRTQLALLDIVRNRLFGRSRSIRLGDFAVSYPDLADIMPLINSLRARLSRYEGSGAVTTVSKGERRPYPIAPRW